MRTVDYSDVLRGSAALAGLAIADLTAAERALLAAFHDRRLQYAWEIHRWPDICRTEQRSFRLAYNPATTYAPGDEVLDLLTLNYFQALRATTGNPPTINQAENSAWWALCKSAYPAPDYASGSAYTLGAQVRNPADNQFYQLFTPPVIRVSGAGLAVYNGDYLYAGQTNGKPAYTQGAYTLDWQSGHWVLRQTGVVLLLYYASASDTASPDLATGWYSTNGNFTPNPVNNPPPAVLAGPVGPLSAFDPAVWGLLHPFNRYVAWEQPGQTAIGDFLFAWDRDPRVTTKLTPLPFTVSELGAQFVTLLHTSVFVWLLYRLRRPLLQGADWDRTLVYASGQTVYFVSAAGPGNFYTCGAATAAGESPDTTPAKWVAVPLPYIFRQYLIQGGYADWLTQDGQTDKAQAGEGFCEQLLELEADKLQRQAGQVNRLQWRS